MSEPVIIGNATLYLGDCREILPTIGKVDAVVTDPPYGTDHVGRGYGRKRRAILNDCNIDVCVDGLEASAALLDDGILLAFHSDKNAAEFVTRVEAFAPRRYSLVWDKKNPGTGFGVRRQHELITVFCKARPILAGTCFSVLSYYRDAKLHPHMKPLQLMRKLLEVFTHAGTTILDPFMGSGTTGVAAVQMGRKFVGIEMEPKYFDIACKRIEETLRQGDMFINAEKPKPPELVGDLIDD